MTHQKRSPQPNGPRDDGRPTTASPAQVDEIILSGLAAGKTAPEICDELGISRSLYQDLVRAMRRRFGLRTTG